MPPATFSDWRYLAVAAAGLAAFFAGPTLGRLFRPLNAFDAAGLSLFCVIGATKAPAFDVGAAQAALLGAITAIGGGMLRDIPMVLRGELYAVPALVGAAIVVAASKLGHHGAATAVTAAAVCFLIRMVGLRPGEKSLPRDKGAKRPKHAPRRPPAARCLRAATLPGCRAVFAVIRSPRLR